MMLKEKLKLPSTSLDSSKGGMTK